MDLQISTKTHGLDRISKEFDPRIFLHRHTERRGTAKNWISRKKPTDTIAEAKSWASVFFLTDSHGFTRKSKEFSFRIFLQKHTGLRGKAKNYLHEPHGPYCDSVPSSSRVHGCTRSYTPHTVTQGSQRTSLKFGGKYFSTIFFYG